MTNLPKARAAALEALEPFARWAEHHEKDGNAAAIVSKWSGAKKWDLLTVADLRRAREAHALLTATPAALTTIERNILTQLAVVYEAEAECADAGRAGFNRSVAALMRKLSGTWNATQAALTDEETGKLVEAAAQIIDPEAFRIDHDGYTVPQIGADAANVKAGAIHALYAEEIARLTARLHAEAERAHCEAIADKAWKDRAAEAKLAALTVGGEDGWRPEVRAFADLMEATLRRNDHKGGWKTCKRAWLWERCREELTELLDAMDRQQAYDTSDRGARLGPAHFAGVIGREAADVANFAMMIADVSGALQVKPDAPTPDLVAMKEAVGDVLSHQASWTAALIRARDAAAPPTHDTDDAGYWRHELDALTRTCSAIRNALGGGPSPP